MFNGDNIWEQFGRGGDRETSKRPGNPTTPRWGVRHIPRHVCACETLQHCAVCGRAIAGNRPASCRVVSCRVIQAGERGCDAPSQPACPHLWQLVVVLGDVEADHGAVRVARQERRAARAAEGRGERRSQAPSHCPPPRVCWSHRHAQRQLGLRSPSPAPGPGVKRAPLWVTESLRRKTNWQNTRLNALLQAWACMLRECQ